MCVWLCKDVFLMIHFFYFSYFFLFLLLFFLLSFSIILASSLTYLTREERKKKRNFCWKNFCVKKDLSCFVYTKNLMRIQTNVSRILVVNPFTFLSILIAFSSSSLVHPHRFSILVSTLVLFILILLPVFTFFLSIRLS